MKDSIHIDRQRVKELRIEKELSTYQIASMKDVSQSYICKIERGRKKNVSQKKAKEIASALGVSISEITFNKGG